MYQHFSLSSRLLLLLLLALWAPVSHAASPPSPVAALHDAVKKGETAKVKALLDSGADANSAAKSGVTPLIWAAIMNRPSTAALLLARGADVNAAIPAGHYDSGLTALIAAANGRSNIYSGAVEPSAPPPYTGKDAAKIRRHNAAVRDWRARVTKWRAGYPSLVKLLVAHGANVNAQMTNGTSAIDSAATAGDTEVVRFLLDRGARLDLPSHEADILGTPHTATNGYYALVGAIYEDKHNPTLVRLLLTHSASPNSDSPSEMTPLGAAASSGDAQIVRLLLEHGARPGDKDYYERTPISYAASHPDVLALLNKATN
ncbi:MAG: ankyrin repeat domain-containing protein [Capsulimonas sp.]